MQLIQGERLAIRDDDVFRWVRRFERFPKVQVIDLDAAMGVGDNLALVRQIAAALSCRVGGGIRTIDRAGTCSPPARSRSSPGRRCSRTGSPISHFAKALADAVGPDRVIAAVDSRGGQVVIHGWKTALPLTAVEAVRALEPFCGEFLYTHVDTEGLMGGTNIEAIRAVRHATRRAASPPPAASPPSRKSTTPRPRRRRRRRHGDLHRQAGSSTRRSRDSRLGARGSVGLGAWGAWGSEPNVLTPAFVKAVHATAISSPSLSLRLPPRPLDAAAR